uniref:Uncharacterized protein n=1 Tax=Globodera rostochiensis TaxID=31243 RepID=A0A914GRS4_GLORO
MGNNLGAELNGGGGGRGGANDNDDHDNNDQQEQQQQLQNARLECGGVVATAPPFPTTWLRIIKFGWRERTNNQQHQQHIQKSSNIRTISSSNTTKSPTTSEPAATQPKIRQHQNQQQQHNQNQVRMARTRKPSSARTSNRRIRRVQPSDAVFYV